MVKKKTTLYLTDEYVSILKEHDVNVSAFVDNCMELYIEILTSSRTELMQRQKHTQREIEDKRFELKFIMEGLLAEYEFKINNELDKTVYINFINNKGNYSDTLDELMELTGLRKVQLEKLSLYLNLYESKYSDRDDYDDFKESLDYLIRRYNEDNPHEVPLNRDGGSL